MFSGGYDDGRTDRAEILEFEGTGWQVVGMMEEPRYGAAAQAYQLNRLTPIKLTNCT